MNKLDLRTCLENWPYDAEKDIRIGQGVDGREIIWVRKPIGIEQYEVDGRPDGRRVHNMESVLEYHQARANRAKWVQPATGFGLTGEDCKEVFHEAIVYLHRLIVYFRLKEWGRAERDANHILDLLEFVKQNAHSVEDSMQLDSLRPRALHVRAAAGAMMLLDKGQYHEAIKIARDKIGISTTLEDCALGRCKLAEKLIGSVRYLQIDYPMLQANEESLFLRQEDYWTIRYHGHAACLKSSRGLECIASLIRFPGREFHVSELMSNSTEALVAATSPAQNQSHYSTDEHCSVRGFDDGIPILDLQAKNECKRQFLKLREELDEAEHFNNPYRAAQIQEEMNAIAEHLASAIGLGGRDRKTSSEAERARCAVTKRIKNAIEKINGAIPLLGHHFNTRIKTGYFCSYNAHPDRPVAWKFDINSPPSL